MKRKAKRILGSCGLLTVAAVTTVAAFLPAPDTSAVSSVTDTIVVRVASMYPKIELKKILSSGEDIENGATVAKSKVTLEVDFSSISEASYIVDYVDAATGAEKTKTLKTEAINGEETRLITFDLYDLTGVDGVIETIADNGEVKLASVTRDGSAGVSAAEMMDVSRTARSEQVIYAVNKGQAQNFRLAASTSEFGYGRYTFRIVGTNSEGVSSNMVSAVVNWVPVKGSLCQTGNNYCLNLDYEWDDPADPNSKGVRKIVIHIKKKGSNTDAVTPIVVENGEKQVILPLVNTTDKDVLYVISWEAFDEDNDKVGGESEEVEVRVKPGHKPGGDEPGGDEPGGDTPGGDEPGGDTPGGDTPGEDQPGDQPGSDEPSGPDAEVPNTGAPDTGRFGGKLNISKVDYLITGLIVFGVTVVAGIVFVLRTGKKSNKR